MNNLNTIRNPNHMAEQENIVWYKGIFFSKINVILIGNLNIYNSMQMSVCK